ncbi:MAG: rod shape-determining protein MreC [Streptococcaceae bacterium]|nr:rod shape-determining protein MreC [Streptococcaceae bacterium]
MNKFNSNKNIIISLIIAIIVIGAVTVSTQRRAKGEETTPVGSFVSDSIGVVDKVLASPGRMVSRILENLKDLQITFEENQALKHKLDDYDEAVIETKNLKEEVEKLQKELDLNKTLTQFSKITANVIARSPENWQDILVVDRGKKDGVQNNMAVMSQSGLVGRVVQVNEHSSKVELLTSNNQTSNHFPVRISTSKESSFGLLKKYDEETNTFIVSELTTKDNIKPGDLVQTSGLGGSSPANLLVGTVDKVEVSENGLGTNAYIKPATQMYDISVVTIIKRSVGEG